MDILVITDMPRMVQFFEQLGRHYPGLTVVNEIHHGIEQLEKRQPEVVIFQNHLAGLSAEILYKHLRSKINGRTVRFGLISAAGALDSGSSAQFDALLDPTQQDEQLTQIAQNLFAQQTSLPEEPAANDTQTADADQFIPQTPPEEHPLALYQRPITTTAPLAQENDQQAIAPGTYGLPRRPGISITSDFSQQLDTNADSLQTGLAETDLDEREQELSIRDLHREPHLITDLDEPAPWYRKTGVLLGIATLLAVVGITLLQHRGTSKSTPSTNAKVVPAAPAAVPAAPAAVPAPAAPAAPQPEAKPALTSHGAGRPRALPSFIPREGLEQGYGKEHPGWENYRGPTNEYRVFREKDATIKAIQVIDRSGAGIQESFYTTIIKELTGATVMKPTSSEIKEGYEIRRGEQAGLQLVQYRDAQGGRLRGFVITWP